MIDGVLLASSIQRAVYFPAFIATYTHRNVPFRLYVNGADGSIDGDRVLSVPSVAISSALAAAPLAAMVSPQVAALSVASAAAVGAAVTGYGPVLARQYMRLKGDTLRDDQQRFDSQVRCRYLDQIYIEAMFSVLACGVC